MTDQDHADQRAGGQQTGRQQSGAARLWEGLRHGGRSQAVVAVLLALLGFAAVTQVRSVVDDNSYTGYREQDLIDVLDGLAGTTQRAQTELNRLEQRRADLQSSSRRDQAALDEARSQVETLQILAGQVPVTGPGIRVRITEKTSEVNVDTFLDLIEELRSVGAEAIAVNGRVRLVAESSFDKAPGGLLVDGTLVEPPYVVDAIGEPTTLAGAVTFFRGPQDEFEADGATVTLDKRTALDITAVRGRDQSGSDSSTSAGDQ
jgi:uncharacterized protein YlxW (UPF0749 family)